MLGWFGYVSKRKVLAWNLVIFIPNLPIWAKATEAIKHRQRYWRGQQSEFHRYRQKGFCCQQLMQGWTTRLRLVGTHAKPIYIYIYLLNQCHMCICHVCAVNGSAVRRQWPIQPPSRGRLNVSEVGYPWKWWMVVKHDWSRLVDDYIFVVDGGEWIIIHYLVMVEGG